MLPALLTQICTKFTKINTVVGQSLIEFLFVINDNIEEMTTTGGTHGGPGIVDLVKVEIPFGRFKEIYEKLESGNQCYSEAEDFITDVNLTLSHELTHILQNLFPSDSYERSIKLELFENDEYANEIAL